MQLTFLGANRQVTGSRYCLEAGGRKVMIDCGLFQERPYASRNWEPCPVAADQFDALLLTHAHIDHSGLIPKFVREGFRGPIYATRPTVALCEIMLRDSARVQEEDAAYKRRRHQKEGRRGKYPEQRLYVEADVERALPRFRGVDYAEPVKLGDGITVVFRDAGHILGSAMLEVNVTENGASRRIIFSGDVGQCNKPLIADPTLIRQADYVVMESTYGDRDHPRSMDIETQLQTVIDRTVRRGGNVVIPTFALERAQELVFYINRLVHDGRIPRVPVFVDSPMAVDVTGVFHDFEEYLDPESRELFRSGRGPLHFSGLKLVRSADESKAINRLGEACIIMAASGMCTGGRIKHHLRHNIGRPESTILFVGYQAHGTLGRQILDGNAEVRIHGRMHPVRAEIAEIEGLSAHADRAGLLRWLGGFEAAPRHLFLTHGEEQVALGFAQRIERDLGWPVSVPHYRSQVELV